MIYVAICGGIIHLYIIGIIYLKAIKIIYVKDDANKHDYDSV